MNTKKQVISDETIEKISILAQLDLSESQKDKAKSDMEQMLEFMDIIKKADTGNVEPMTHVLWSENCETGQRTEFREDKVTNNNGTRESLANASWQKNNLFQVPKTV